MIEDSSISLIHGDCLESMAMIRDETVYLFITSPPYNLGSEPWPHLGHWKKGSSSGSRAKWKNGADAGVGIQYGGKLTDAMPWEDYCRWQRQVISRMWTLLRDDGAIFYNHKPRVIGARLWTPFELIPADVILRQIVIWARPGGMNFSPTAFVPTHEWIMIFAKEKFRLKSKGVSGLGDVWRMTPDRNEHPAPFPVELPDRIIEATTGSIVVDPFMGSGTVGVACVKSGRRFVGIESNDKYFNEAQRRIGKCYG